jgi:hypothetical protein
MYRTSHMEQHGTAMSIDQKLSSLQLFWLRQGNLSPSDDYLLLALEQKSWRLQTYRRLRPDKAHTTDGQKVSSHVVWFRNLVAYNDCDHQWNSSPGDDHVASDEVKSWRLQTYRAPWRDNAHSTYSCIKVGQKVPLHVVWFRNSLH